MKLTKLAQLKEAWHRGDRLRALRMAARFQKLGNADEAIRRAAAFSLSPKVYAQLGYDYDKVLLDGYAALQRRYKLPDAEYVDA